MKQNNRCLILILLIAGCFSQSCKKQMISLNTNPTSLSTVAPEYLFTGTTVDFNFNTRQQLINRYTFMTYMQYVVPDGINANLGGNYWAPGANTGPAPSVTYYSDFYNGVGVSMNRIIAQIDAMPQDQQQSYQSLKAICQILYVYTAWQVVDIYGAMPYREAFQPDKYPMPVYDYDFTLYKTFDSTLRVAATTLSVNNPKSVNLNQQDFFYGGDISSWEAFANTLRIKIGQRFEKRDPANLASILTDLASNFNSVIISSNAQSFGYNHTQNWNTNVDDINNILLNYDAGYAFVEFLKSTRDPRLPLLIRQNDFGTNDAIYNNVESNGTPQSKATLDSIANSPNNSRYWGKHAFPASQDPSYGWTGQGRFQSFPLAGQSTPASLGFLSAIQTRYLVKNGGFGGFDARSSQSLMHTDEKYVDPTTIKNRTLFLTYAETCFMMAEIAQKGGNGLGKSASDWYNAGVQASFDQYKADGIAANVPGADTTQIGDFLTRYPYDGTLAQIYSQEWVHDMIEPEESWAMWKRTGYPQFADFRPGQPTLIGDGSGIAYLESLWNGSQNLTIPRRAAFIIANAGSVLNQTNFTNALQTMQAKNPDYGPDGSYAIGRVWWDEK